MTCSHAPAFGTASAAQLLHVPNDVHTVILEPKCVNARLAKALGCPPALESSWSCLDESEGGSTF